MTMLAVTQTHSCTIYRCQSIYEAWLWTMEEKPVPEENPQMHEEDAKWSRGLHAVREECHYATV